MVPPAIQQAVAADPVRAENIMHQAMMRMQDDTTAQLDAVQAQVGQFLADLFPVFSTTLTLAVLCVVVAYLAGPKPAIWLPARGMFGINRRKRVARSV